MLYCYHVPGCKDWIEGLFVTLTFALRYRWMCSQTEQLHKGPNVCQHARRFPLSPCGLPKNPSCHICEDIARVSLPFPFWHPTTSAAPCSLFSFFPPAAVNATLVRWTTGHVPRPLTPSPTITWPWCPTSRPPGSCSGCRRCVRSATRSVSPCSGESKRAATSQCSVRTVWRVSWCWSVLCRGPPRWRLRWRWPSWRGEPS